MVGVKFLLEIRLMIRSSSSFCRPSRGARGHAVRARGARRQRAARVHRAGEPGAHGEEERLLYRYYCDINA